MNVTVLRDRWTTAEGQALQADAFRWLDEGGKRPGGLSEFEGRVDLRGITLPDPRILGKMVAGGLTFDVAGGVISLKGARWSDLDLSQSRLSHLRFTSSVISNCRFDGADCLDWRLWRSEVNECSFERADLRDAAIGTWQQERGNVWRDVSFDRADLRGAFTHGGLLSGCTFRGSRLVGFQFLFVAIEDCVFAGRMKNVLFDERTIAGKAPPAPLRRVDFSESIFEDVDFRGCHFEDVRLPTTPSIRLIEKYPMVARRALELASITDSVEGRRVAAVLRGDLKLPGADDSVTVFNRDDWLSWGGEALADVWDTILVDAQGSLDD
jgi:uncharacterized protein YjbI with pentapeptide repeats